eukprot:m.307682 g.307682  ORF g.307682 m.307682 type:complete len:425 (+) comp42617_c0_seq1:254-1528(+)
MDKLRAMVSKKKRRFQEKGYDLDLTYIKPNIVAMGFPSDKLEGMFRNHIEDVARFFDEKHLDHYKIYNLCSERVYDAAPFHHRVVRYGFDDHNAPPFELVQPFCDDVEAYLKEHKSNVAVIHCKAGKGRTGVMICAYMLHIGLFDTTREALSFYGVTRTSNAKGVTIPSQRRYVNFYGHYIRNRLTYRPTTLLLRRFEISGPPNFRGGCSPFFLVRQGTDKVKLYTSAICSSSYREKSKDGESRKVQRMDLPSPVPICGDIVFEFYHLHHRFKKEKIFQFWLNTFFIRAGAGNGDGESMVRPEAEPNNAGGSSPADRVYKLTFEQEDLDKANKDKKHYPDHFRLFLYWSPLMGDDDEDEQVDSGKREEDGVLLSPGHGGEPSRQIPPSPRNDGYPTLHEEEDDNFHYSDTDEEEEEEWGQTSKV